jgi:hypothetical protein
LGEEDFSELFSFARFVGEPQLGTSVLNIDTNGIPFALALASETSFYGDANLDGIVDAADLNILGKNWLREDVSGWSEGDFNGDQRVDQFDLNALGENWLVENRSTAAAVPEPSSMVLFSMFLVTLSFRSLLRSCPNHQRHSTKGRVGFTL